MQEVLEMENKTKKILVVGDVMLDSYVFGQVNRISPEAPVPILLCNGREKQTPGGAANVSVNLSAIGIETFLCSLVGNDSYGDILLQLLSEKKVDISNVHRCNDRPTTNKLRYIGQNNQQIMRIDREVNCAIDKEWFMNCFDDAILDVVDMIIISDYLKGVLTTEITQYFISQANNRGIPVLVDVKDRNVGKYHGATLLKPNRKELADLTGMSVFSIEDVKKAAMYLCCEAKAKYVLVTLGAEGMLLANSSDVLFYDTGIAKEVSDVTGAGDTSMAYLAFGILQGYGLEDAIKIANCAAGIKVSKFGTSIVYPEEVLEMFVSQKIKIDEERNVIRVAEYLKKQGRRLVFTNGCFDILHAGHVSYLNEAKKLGDVLIVGINNDDSVKKLKGDNRPVNSLKNRMLVLQSLKCVDYVISFAEDTPINLIEQIKPDVLVKGGDYDVSAIVGNEFVKKNGGEVVTIPYVNGLSSTEIIKRMKRDDCERVDSKKN